MRGKIASEEDNNMILKCILLALSASIDALSIGVTYGIKKTKMSKASNIIIFLTLLCLTGISVLVGHYISILFSPTFSVWLGSLLLIILGIYNIYKARNNISTDFDADNSNYIDAKEALVLGLAVSIDASCVSLGSGMIGLGSFILPIFMAIFHTFFVNCGNLVTRNLLKRIKIPENVLVIFSGVILILVGLLKIVF